MIDVRADVMDQAQDRDTGAVLDQRFAMTGRPVPIRCVAGIM